MSALLYTLIPSFLAFFLQSGSFALSVSAWISAASGTRPIRAFRHAIASAPKAEGTP
ncbi:hypothetical protein V6Z11_D11G032000 [Gossypium hirsutum]